MLRDYFFLCLFGIWGYFLTPSVAREAILGGRVTYRRDAFPYQVSVQIHEIGHVCGGCILSERFVLTAAHCVLNKSRLLRSSHITVVAGTANLNYTGPPTETAPVEKIFFPKEFHPTIVFNVGDIAVLKLKKSLPLEGSTNLKKLELPHHLNARGIMILSGFGWNTHRKNHHEVTDSSNGHLTFAVVDIYDIEDCEDAYPLGAINYNSHFCARIRQIQQSLRPHRYGACNGDDGGPLVEQDSVVVGILTRTIPNCDERTEPAIYTRIVFYAGMIHNVMVHDRDPEMVSLQI